VTTHGAAKVARAIGLNVSHVYRLIKPPAPMVHASTLKLVRAYLDDQAKARHKEEAA